MVKIRTFLLYFLVDESFVRIGKLGWVCTNQLFGFPGLLGDQCPRLDKKRNYSSLLVLVLVIKLHEHEHIP